jgi:hypothetical protein
MNDYQEETMLDKRRYSTQITVIVSCLLISSNVSPITITRKSVKTLQTSYWYFKLISGNEVLLHVFLET